jgi:hypothetical protein
VNSRAVRTNIRRRKPSEVAEGVTSAAGDAATSTESSRADEIPQDWVVAIGIRSLGRAAKGSTRTGAPRRIYNPLIWKDKSHQYCAQSSDEGPARSVLFAQHLSEIVRLGMWAGRFFVAARNPSVNVTVRRRGEPQVDSSGVFGEWKDRTVWGRRGPSRAVQTTRP